MLDKFCAVTPQGDRILIALPGSAGKSREIELSFDEASALAMTLPRLLKMALSRRFPDDRLRHVYGLGRYSVECASDLRHLLLTLSAAEGFEVCFAIDRDAVRPLSNDLVDGMELLEMSEPVRPN